MTLKYVVFKDSKSTKDICICSFFVNFWIW